MTPSFHRKSNAARHPYAQAFLDLEPRQRFLAIFGLIVLLVFTLWIFWLKPTLALLDKAPSKLAQAESQLFSAQAMAKEAFELRQSAKPTTQSKAAALGEAMAPLGEHARLARASATHMMATLKDAQGSDIAAMLAALRLSARVYPSSATLNKNPSTDLWSGSISFPASAQGDTP
jgi:type II secretory pathway component PulM